MRPSLKEFASALWCDRGYHIFIFTGHSGSNADGTIGWIEVNNSERLAIEEFKDSFKQAIDRGLQLAIFNSCDGLGLADRLSELNLAQIIVMSEPVPDEIAIEFLEHFFSALISSNSLFGSVRQARQKLEHFNNRYPGAVWLPTLCLKPAQEYFSWSQINAGDRFKVSLSSDDKIAAPQSTNFWNSFIRAIAIAVISLLIFISGLSSNLIFPDWEATWIAQPILNIVDRYINLKPEFDLPLGTWQYSGSTTWHSIADSIKPQLREKYPHFRLVYTHHPILPSGSSTGIRMLLDGQISFALSSRPVKDNEYEVAIVRGKILKQVPTAIDGVAVVVNPQLSIDGLTIKQLEAIYRGKITN